METVKSPREAEAHARADRRLRRQRNTLRPLALIVIAAVAIGAASGHPPPGRHGEGLGVAVAFVVFAVSRALAVRNSFVDRSTGVRAIVIAAMGTAGVALVALQPRGATELAGGAALWTAIALLPLLVGAVLSAAVAAGIDLAEALRGGSAAVVLAAALVCALLALVAYFIKQARASQAETELLLAQLEDAREEQLRAAAVTERGRIARKLHDVLAHALSGAAIQLQGARKLAEREAVSPQVRAAIDRAAELVREGLTSARQAVGALRGEKLPSITELESLVATFKDDTHADMTLTVEGAVRPLPPDASLALYRGAKRRSRTSPAMHPAPRRQSSSVTAAATRRSPSRTA